MSLAAPAEWWEFTPDHLTCLQGGYEATRSALQSALLQMSGVAREQTRAHLAALELAREHVQKVHHARQRTESDPERREHEWQEVQRMAQQLARLYWDAHERDLRPTTRTLPHVPHVFGDKERALIASAMPVDAVLRSYTHAQSGTGWTTSDEGHPAFTHRTAQLDTTMQVRPEEPTIAVENTVVESLWAQVRELSDLDGDVFLAMLAQAMAAPADEEGCVWLSGQQILEYRGIKPKFNKHEGGQMRRGGHRQEDLEEVAHCVARQASQWVIIRSAVVDESAGAGKRRGRAPRRTRTKYTHESRLTQIVEVVRQRDLALDSEAGGEAPRSASYAIAWRYKMGTWLTRFLDGPNRQVAWLCQQALKYDPVQERWEKRLARFFTLHLLRINATRSAASITRNVGKLISELGLPVEARNPERTRKRFEQALDRLVADKQIGMWRYADNG